MPTALLVARAPVVALPIELLAAIIEYLAPAERLRAASVSRDFRAAAHIAGFAIHYRLKWRLGRPIRDALADLSGLISHIARANLRISLDFVCCPVGVPNPWEQSLDEFLDIILVISAAIQLMTSFTATVPEQFLAVFYEKLLCLPAPNLRSLSLMKSSTAESWNPDIHPIPGSLFSENAPTLRELSLFYIQLPVHPLRAFACVRTLRIICDDGYPPMALARHFPALTSLQTEFRCDTQRPSATRVEQAFTHLSLDELTLDCTRIRPCDPTIGRLMRIADTRIVQLIGSSIFWEESLLGLPSGSGSLSVSHRRVDTGMEITVAHNNQDWRRVLVYDGSCETDAYNTLAQCPSFRDAVTYMRLDCSLIGNFLDATCELPALRELRIDMCAPKGYRRIGKGYGRIELLPAYPPVDPDFNRDPYYYVPCPALRTLTVFVLDAAAEIDALEAAHLGRALGQVARPKDERAHLVLIGVVFSNNSEYTELLDQAFSDVQLRPFAGEDSLEDRQCFIWGL